MSLFDRGVIGSILKDPGIHRLWTGLLLLSLLPIEFICFIMAWMGYTRDIEDFIGVAIMHWPTVLPLWFILRRLRKHNNGLLTIPISLLLVSECLMSLLLLYAILEAPGMVRENFPEDVRDARLWLANGLLAEVLKIWLLVFGFWRISRLHSVFRKSTSDIEDVPTI